MRADNILVGILLLPAIAHGQHLVFTMLTHPTCPLVMASISSSRDFGFQSVALRNDSGKAIESIRLRVVLATPRGRDEWVDGGRVFARLEPGDRKEVEVFLGRTQALSQRARELKLGVGRAIVMVESADFSDGTRWTDEEPVVGVPDEPRPIK